MKSLNLGGERNRQKILNKPLKFPFIPTVLENKIQQCKLSSKMQM